MVNRLIGEHEMRSLVSQTALTTNINKVLCSFLLPYIRSKPYPGSSGIDLDRNNRNLFLLLNADLCTSPDSYRDALPILPTTNLSDPIPKVDPFAKSPVQMVALAYKNTHRAKSYSSPLSLFLVFITLGPAKRPDGHHQRRY